MSQNDDSVTKRVFACDWDFSLRGPGMKREFFTSADIDYQHFNRRFLEWVGKAHPLLDERARRQKQPEFLTREMFAGELRSLSTGEPGQLFEPHHFHEFAEEAKVYEGVEETLVAIREAIESTGARPVVAILTNAFAPLIRFGPLFRSGFIDYVRGQEFHVVDIRGKQVALPKVQKGKDPKITSINWVMSRCRVGGSSVLQASDGYGEGALMEHLHHQGGRNVGLHNTREKKSSASDLVRLKDYESKGWLDAIVENDYSENGLARGVLVEQALQLVDARFQRIDHEADRGLESRSLIA